MLVVEPRFKLKPDFKSQVLPHCAPCPSWEALLLILGNTAVDPDMPLSSTVVMHQGHKDIFKIQILVTYFGNTKSKSPSVRPMKFYFRKLLPGNSDADSSVQVCELTSVSHCSGAFNFPVLSDLYIHLRLRKNTLK